MSKSKSTPKVKSPEPKYKLAQKAYFILYHKGKPEEIVEGMVINVTIRAYETKDYLGKKTGTGISYTYVLTTSGIPVNALEAELYPNFTEAAKVFAKAFLTLLK